MKTIGMAMKKAVLMCLMILATVGVFAQDEQKVEKGEQVLMTIEGESITVEDFLMIYNKNNASNVIDRKSMDEYLTLFVNFKLKVQEAEELKMDTAQKFINELAGYRRQLAQPYLVDRQMNDQLLQEAYDRMQQDVAAYHILVKVDENATPKDTLKALNTLKAIAKRIETERDMIDEMTKIRNGDDKQLIAEDLGYFTAFSMVYPFETAAYQTEVGDLSKPVRTRFGYHVIYVNDKRPARGEIKTSHIMVAHEQTGEKDPGTDRAKEKIDEIYERLKNGEDFETLAQEYSDDKGSARNGGKLPWFGTGRMVPEFEDAAFQLAHNGDVIEPVRTNYGWHLIKRDDYRGIGSFDELEASIKKRIERDARGQKGRISLLKKLKEAYSLNFNYKNRDAVHKLVTDEYLEGKWKPEEDLDMEGIVLTISEDQYADQSMNFAQSDYLDYLKRFQKRFGNDKKLSDILADQWEAFVDASLINFEDELLDEKYPEFKALMQEYHDGILLFDLMDDKVWSKAVEDTAGLEAFYESNKSDFMWDERVDASVYLCENADVAKQAEKLAKKRIKKGYTDNDILDEVNEDNPLQLSIRSGLYAKGDDESIDAVTWEKGIHRVDGNNGKIVLVQIYDVLEPQPKSLAEARGLVTSAYQTFLEEEWVASLREKYDFEVDFNVFQSIEKE
jgi:peptidyl-prolyl cis-trans isomerase SurA